MHYVLYGGAEDGIAFLKKGEKNRLKIARSVVTFLECWNDGIGILGKALLNGPTFHFSITVH